MKVHFTNADGERLTGRLELPTDRAPHGFAIFAHCFTCTKNLSAVRYIARTFADHGMGVLRFDFTGLGESEGDFAATSFSHNVGDLVSAARFLADEYMAPSVLIGHSLGGAAVVMAADELPEVKAVVTIGAPAEAVHVKHLLSKGLDQIASEGEAEVNIGGRPFRIRREFIEDLERRSVLETLKQQRGKSYLFMHSPQDSTVEIENAARLYKAAHHPKSFISLDGADHLLSDKQDSCYVGDMIGTWLKRYVMPPEIREVEGLKPVVAHLTDEHKFATNIHIEPHHIVADEPTKIGGNDFGPTPYELVASGLGACTAMTMRMYADRKKWDIKEIIVHLSHDRQHAEQAGEFDDKTQKIDRFERHIEIIGNLDEAQRQRMLEIANRCPVHLTLEKGAEVQTVLVERKG